MGSTVIIGGGIIGTSIAHALREQEDVTLLEKNTLGSGTTAASMARMNWNTPHPLRLYLQRESWNTYEPLIDDGTLDFDQCGLFLAAHSESELAERRAATATLTEYGLEFELIEGNSVADHGLNPDTVRGGLYQPDAGYINQQDAVEHFATVARDAGVRIETGVTVTDITVDEGAVTGVETTDGTYSADIVINAAGPWAPEVNRFVDVSLPLRHTTGPILVLDAGTDLSMPYISKLEGDFYFRPEGDSKALAGRRWGRYDEAERLNPDAATTIPASFRRDVSRITSDYAPQLEDVDIINEWNGLRTITPDFKPIIGDTRPDGPDGFLVACGMSGSGIGLAPVVGRIIRDVVTGTDSDFGRLFSADRFGSGRRFL